MSLVKPEHFFLERFGLTSGNLDRILGGTLGRTIDAADIYFEYTSREVANWEDGRPKEATGEVAQGMGVRVQAGEKTGYAFSDEINVKRLEIAASQARMIASGLAEEGIIRVPVEAPAPHNLYPVRSRPLDVPLGEKRRLFELIDAECRAYDPRIKNVFITLEVEDKRVLVVSRDGWMVGDSRPLSVLRIRCMAEEGDRREMGYEGGGGRMEYSFYLEDERWKKLAKEAARRAIVNLSAREAPAGPMVVVLGPGWPGILLHEAIGHGLEGDFNRKKVSAFSEKVGQRVAAEICTVVDDGTIPGRRGSLNIDDEGTPTQRNVLIDRGIVVGYMQDKLNARLMGMHPTGNGRRESYRFPAMPRMTNTFMLSGESLPEDIIRSVKSGLYAVHFGGGQVDITNGKFVFSMSEAYLIEDGRVTAPVKGATLIGDGPTVLTRISMVGNDLSLDLGIGTCGKNGQQVPVGVGIPTVRVDEITVGGTSQEIRGGMGL